MNDTTSDEKNQIISEISRVFCDTTPESFRSYTNLFAQRIPRYAVKAVGDSKWQTRQAALHDAEIRKHLAGQQVVACLSMWYPQHAVLDFDSMPRSKVEEIRAGLMLDDANSMLLSSESKDSYHVYFRTLYNGKPPTINLLQTVLLPYAKARGVEVYPQRNRAFRLPFGKGQRCLDERDKAIQGWQNQLHFLKKKEDFDLSIVKGHQTFFEFKPTDRAIIPPADLVAGVDVAALLENGLQGPSTRDRAQFELIRHLWRQNVTQNDAVSLIWGWICSKHNGYSQDFLRDPQGVRRHIQHQVIEYYAKMQYYFTLPDRPHISHKGFVCESDLVEIVDLCRGYLPRMRFAFELVKYMNPRHHRESVPIHRDKLVEWSGVRTYLPYLQYLEGKGIIERGSGYRVGERSKGLKLKWDYQSDKEAVLYGGRAVETLEQAVSTIFKPVEFRELLGCYVKRTTALMTTKTLFEGCQKRQHI